jgi:hypothetical protein
MISMPTANPERFYGYFGAASSATAARTADGRR